MAQALITRWVSWFVLVGIVSAGVVLPLAGVVVAEDTPGVYQGRDADEWAQDLASADMTARRNAMFAMWTLGAHARPHVRAVALAIRDDDEYVRTTADKVLARFEWQSSINTLSTALPELIDALQDERVVVRVTAANLIWMAGPIPNVVGGEPPPVELVPALMKALKDDDARVRANAAASLANLAAGARSALPALAMTIDDPDPQVRMWTLRALGWIDPSQSVALIVKAIDDEHVGVRTAAAEALGGAPADQKDAALAALRTSLADEQQGVRLASVNSLWALGYLESLPWLTGVLETDPDPGVRSTAANAIGGLGAPESVPVLLAMMKDDNAMVRAGATTALGRLGPEAAVGVPALIELLEDDSPSVKSAAAIALSQLAHFAAPAIPALIGTLMSEDSSVRMMGASALMQIVNMGSRDARVLTAMTGLLDDDDPMVVQYAAQAVGHFGADAGDAVPLLVVAYARQPEAYAKRAVLIALARMDSAASDAAVFLRKRAETVDGSQLAAAGALARVAKSEADVSHGVQILINALADEQTRYEAIHQLGVVGPRAQRAALFLRIWMQGDAPYRLPSAEALLKIDPERAGDALAVLLEAVQADGNRQAVRHLGEAGAAARGAIPALVDLASDPASGSRAEALTALRRIGADGEAVERVFAVARSDPSAWIRTLGALGLASLESR